MLHNGFSFIQRRSMAQIILFHGLHLFGLLLILNIQLSLLTKILFVGLTLLVWWNQYLSLPRHPKKIVYLNANRWLIDGKEGRLINHRVNCNRYFIHLCFKMDNQKNQSICLFYDSVDRLEWCRLNAYFRNRLFA